jgi:hypothetical protein
MKKIFITVMMMMTVSAYASIEHDGKPEPTANEISKSRSCFEEVSQNGCGDPGDDIKQFRSCLNNIFPSLTGDCQKMMTHLYSRRK